MSIDNNVTNNASPSPADNLTNNNADYSRLTFET